MDPFGTYKTAISARATDKAILKKSQDGGIISASYIYGLENGLLDGVIVANTEDGFKAVPKIATTPEEVLSAAGTKYTVSPNISVLKDAVREYALEKVGIVGTPCQVRAIRKLMKYPMGFRHTDSKIALVMGIFCMENFPYEGMKAIVEQYAGIRMNDVLKTDIGKGKFWVYSKSGDVKAVPLKDTHMYEQKSCHVCMDYTAELADISTGSVGSPDGWSTIFVRTAKGEEYLNKMIDAGALETKPIEDVKPGLDLVQKLALQKKEKNDKEIVHRKEMGLPVPY
ncbi:coenzyme F420 hydrogenase subunit beta [Methanococcus maripaludis]|uniref:Coenzyme F420 hydrogenase subunit beta n=1 Tax=Methanococcus maripaludis TaxID=39152 RepID=A0A7J9PAA1_METMI|nr:coenzyme F420 hydrogenase subunit beta [Methanococcus maripaludis]MBA2840409.1 coenzyme F420 hydrogenase subunit beta [Methanococcus maripaludis]MBA2853872.1 coenzyme F420 hydrogenase subunit beta [Methanococcus maripaludis]MBA2860122.1 coenzyme F420 hydrogenase subunit beta [Methanococcus maripaludis]